MVSHFITRYLAQALIICFFLTVLKRDTTMHLISALGGLSLASVALALPHSRNSRVNANNQVVVYWGMPNQFYLIMSLTLPGQNGGGTIENNDLSTYCTSSSGIDVIVLAFLYEYGQVSRIQHCANLAKIQVRHYCKRNHWTVVLHLDKRRRPAMRCACFSYSNLSICWC